MRLKNLVYLGAALFLLAACTSGPQDSAAASGDGASSAGPSSASLQFPRPIGRRGSRVKEVDERTKLVAKGDPASEESQWFDVTDAPIDPGEFQYGIGKDTIPAIDEPLFVAVGDPRLEAQHITDDSRVIGYAVGDDARAYPIRIMDRHELVNDTVGGKPVTVGW